MSSEKTTNPELPDELLNYFLEVSPYAIAIKDESLRICCANKAYCELHNTPLEEILGTTGFEHLPKSFAKKSKAEEKAVLKSGETLEKREGYQLSNTESFQFVIKRSVFTTSAGKKYLIIQYEDLSAPVVNRDELEKSNHQLEDRLEKLQEQIRFKDAVLEYTSDAIVFIDEHGTFLYRSSGVEKISGYRDEDLLGQGIFKLIHPSDVNDALNTLRKVIENPNTPVSFEHRVRHKEGHYIWLEGTAINHIAENAVGAIVLNYRDVTWRKTALSTPNKNGVAYEQLFTSMADMFHIIELVYNDDGKPIDFIEVEVNPAVEKLYGLPSEKIIGQRITSILGTVEDYWLEVFDSVVKTGTPAYFENYNEGLDRYYRINAWLTANKKLAVIFSDITSKKEAELSIQRNADLLSGAQSIAKLGGWELDLRTSKIYWTEETYRLHEVDPQKWVPTVENGVSFYTPESQKIITAALEKAIKNKEDFDVECQFVTAKGNLLDVRATGKTVVEEDEVVKVLGIFQDITDRKQAERELQLKTLLLEDAEAISKLGGWELDLKTGQIYWTANTYRLHEVDPETWVPTVENGVAFYTEDSRKVITAALEKAIQNQEDFDVECQFVTAKGNLLDVRATGTTVVDGDEVVKIIGVFQDISEKKNEEAELERKSILLEESHKITGIGAWEVDLTNDIVLFTEQTFRIHELSIDTKYPTLDEAIGYYTKDCQKVLYDTLDELLQKKRDSFDFELKLITAKGNELDVRLTGKSVLERGSVAKILGVLHDITKQKAVETEFNLQKLLLEDSQRIAKVGGWELDIATGNLFWTAETYRIHDTSPEEFDPTVDAGVSYFLPDSKRKIEKALDQAINKGVGYDLELDTYTTKGRLITVRTTCVVTEKDGKPATLTGSFQDITDLKRAEKEKEEQRRILQESQRVAKVGGWTFDVKPATANATAEFYRILDVSEFYEGLFFVQFFNFILFESRRELARALGNALNNGNGFDIESKLRANSGEIKDVRITCSVVKEKDQPAILNGTLHDITEYKHLQRQILDSQRFFSESQKAASIGSYRLYVQKNKWESSQVLNNILGIPDDYTKTLESWSELVHPEDRDMMLAYFQKTVFEQGGDFNKEYRIVRSANRETRWVLGLGKVKYADNQPIEMVGTIQDITQRKQTEQALRNSEERFSQVSQASRVCIWEIDNTGIFKYVSPNVAAILGYGQSEITDKVKLSSLVSKNKQEAFRKLLSDHENSQDIVRSQTEFSHKNGSVLHIEIDAFPVYNDNGENIGYRGSIKDVTERVIQQQEIVKLSEVAAQNPASVVITDLNGSIEYVNKKFEEVTGYSATEVLGKNPRILSSGELPKSEYTKLWETVLSGKSWSGELHNVKKDGTKFWERALIAPIKDDDGKVVKLMGLKVDINEEKRISDELEFTLHNLEELVDERTESLTKAKQELEVAHKSLLSSLQYAKRIQQASIPTTTELRSEVADAFVIFKPRDVVSGDFYWFYKTENGLILSVADSTGHGVPGAMLSMIGVELFDHIVRRRRTHQPKTILEKINYGVISTLSANSLGTMQDGMDMSVVNIDYQTQKLSFASARSFGVFVSDNNAVELETSKESIGGVKQSGVKKFKQSDINFKKGDKLYLFSDGFADQFGGPHGKKFMRKRLLKLIEKNAHLNMKEQKREFEKALADWMKGHFQVDDITLIGIEL